MVWLFRVIILVLSCASDDMTSVKGNFVSRDFDPLKVDLSTNCRGFGKLF